MSKLYSNPYIRGFVLSLEVTAKVLTVLPVEGAGYAETLIEHIRNGGQVLFYGSEQYADSKGRPCWGLNAQKF